VKFFYYGFFRRDFGAAGLYDMRDLFTVRQLIVTSVILTLFVPCIAQFLIMVKERGHKAASIYFNSCTSSFYYWNFIKLNINSFYRMTLKDCELNKTYIVEGINMDNKYNFNKIM